MSEINSTDDSRSFKAAEMREIYEKIERLEAEIKVYKDALEFLNNVEKFSPASSYAREALALGAKIAKGEV